MIRRIFGHPPSGIGVRDGDVSVRAHPCTISTLVAVAESVQHLSEKRRAHGFRNNDQAWAGSENLRLNIRWPNDWGFC